MEKILTVPLSWDTFLDKNRILNESNSNPSFSLFLDFGFLSPSFRGLNDAIQKRCWQKNIEYFAQEVYPLIFPKIREIFIFHGPAEVLFKSPLLLWEWKEILLFIDSLWPFPEDLKIFLSLEERFFSIYLLLQETAFFSPLKLISNQKIQRSHLTEAVVVPSERELFFYFLEKFLSLEDKKYLKVPPFLFLSEETLHRSWSGIEKLYTIPGTLSKEGLRKLEGFKAAEGVVEDFF